MFTLNLCNKKNAFTLAEVLITLGIIGVVAALTIPTLINNYKAKRLRSQFLKSYSTIQQVFKQMEADDVSLDPRDYGKNSVPKFYYYFMNYLQSPMDCGKGRGVGLTKLPCYSLEQQKGIGYETYNRRTTVHFGYLDDGQIVMPDGSQLYFENDSSKDYIWISVDINGYKNPPNRWGYDLFTFQFIDGELRPMGAQGTGYTDMADYCNPNGDGTLNGIACAQKAKDDTEYFKKLIKDFK